ncbi:MAG: glycosyl hydrolase family 95 catalytic domain-containing protein, partial [Aeoliella sp.]
MSSILEDCSATYTEPWDDVTCRTLHGGAYLGNGDLGVHLGGTEHALVYYLGKNGFHAGNNISGARGKGKWTQHILNLALLTIEKSAGADSGDTYRVTQDLKHSEILAECSMAGASVQTRGYLSPSRNWFVLELSTDSGRDIPLQARLAVIGNNYVAKNAGVESQVAWVTKDPNAEEAPFYVQGAVAARILGAKPSLTTDHTQSCTMKFTLPATGAVVTLFVSAEHTKNSGSPLSTVQAVTSSVTKADITAISAENRKWWKDFWLRSYIRLGDDVQEYWYNHLYLIGSAARSTNDNRPGKAPGHWGPWNRSDDMMWFGNISMNYNGQNPYYGVFTANHVELVDPYIETVKYYSENTGRKRVVNRWVSPTIAAHMPRDCRGVEFELSFTSHGTSCGGGSWIEDGSMPTNAIFGILPAVWKWKYGRDSRYLAETCYPQMLEVVDFFDDYIEKEENGQYAVYGSVHEGKDWFAKNDMFSLGAIRFLYREIITASIELGRDADRTAYWQDILDNISPYPLQTWDETITFRPDWKHDVMDALTFRGGARNTGLMFTTTFDNISAETLPAYRIATCNTLDKGNMFFPQRFGGWQSSNDFGMMFVMAARSGYRADKLIHAIKQWKPEPNGIVSQKRGGGIETAGIVEAINNMLLQSHDNVIRLFPNWNRKVDAEFKRLRTVGAFLVDAKYRGADPVVESVRLFRELGNRCALQGPFDGVGINVAREDNGQLVATREYDNKYAFETEPGISYLVTPAAYVPPSLNAPTVSE